MASQPQMADGAGAWRNGSRALSPALGLIAVKERLRRLTPFSTGAGVRRLSASSMAGWA